MFSKLHVLIDHADGRIRQVSLECLSLGQELAARFSASLTAVVPGLRTESVVEGLSGYGLDEVIQLEHELLETFTPEAYTESLAALIGEENPDLLLMAHTYQNMDLAPRVAARLRTALVSECVGIREEEGEILFVRPMFRNKLNADIRIRSPKPWLISLQSGAFRADSLRSGRPEIVKRSVRLDPGVVKRELGEKVGLTRDRVDLSKADVIIGVGRGIRTKENLTLARELAEVLGGELGASRPVVDNEWLERERQIGSSGQNVAPRLYIGLGISGAIQHVVGIRNSGCIVAVNSDPGAPIFNVAAYGVVGDLVEVLPILTRKLRELRGN
jgi:electron transfer flavoprotein alpha subunit